MASLRDTPTWWMQARCDCRVVSIPLKMLIASYGPDADPAAIANRLVCSARCGQRPYSVALVDDPARSPLSLHYPIRTPPIQLIGEPFDPPKQG